MIFEDYVVRALSLTEIRDKLNSDLDRYPPPESRSETKDGRVGAFQRVGDPAQPQVHRLPSVEPKGPQARGKGESSVRVDLVGAACARGLVSRETFEQADLRGMRNDNAARAPESHEAYRKHAYALRSFLHCGVCGLRMHGKSRRGLAYYTCDATRRPAGMAPSDHPASIDLREDRASEKVIRFLRERVFGPERIPLLRQALAGTDPQADKRRNEVERIRAAIDGLTLRIRRQVANLETEEPGTDVAKEIRRRLEELTSLNAKRQQQLEAAERGAAERPSPEQPLSCSTCSR